MDNLNLILRYVFLKTCRRKYILEHFNETCDFYNCMNCDNCKEKLTDMTDILWPIVMSNQFKAGLDNFEKEYLQPYITYNDKKEARENNLQLFNDLWKWKTYIKLNNIEKKDLTDKLKLKIPSIFIKEIIKIEKKDSFDNMIQHYEMISKK